MRPRFTPVTTAFLVSGLVGGLALSAPRLLGQTDNTGPFGYIHATDQAKTPTPTTPTGLPNGPATADQVLHGRYIVTSSGCTSCHSHGIDDPNDPNWLSGYLTGSTSGSFQIGPFMTYAKNLTPDVNTGIGMFTDRQIFNALRYGLAPDETPDAVITSTIPGQGNFPAMPHYLAPPMPWPEIRNMSDEDLWAIVAYLKHGIKAVNNAVPDSQGPPDFWASSYTPDKTGPFPLPAYPAGNEVLAP
jgi:hypothetical protein